MILLRSLDFKDFLTVPLITDLNVCLEDSLLDFIIPCLILPMSICMVTIILTHTASAIKQTFMQIFYIHSKCS